jgi:hypothetical protein
VSDGVTESDTAQPLLSLTELTERLEDAGDGAFAEAVGQAVRLGPDYTWLLADLLRQVDSPRLAGQVCRGLARNGDQESLAVLRAVVADTGRPWAVRERAISALVEARDRESVPLLQEVSVQSSERILSDAAREAIGRIESPGRHRPLVEIEYGQLFFGFLLDDLESIDYSESASVGYSFDPSEFRRVCDLLQGGAVVETDGVSIAGVLTFRLKDGATMAVRTDGTTYGNISGRAMRSEKLRDFIWERLDRGVTQP